MLDGIFHLCGPQLEHLVDEAVYFLLISLRVLHEVAELGSIFLHLLNKGFPLFLFGFSQLLELSFLLRG